MTSFRPLNHGWGAANALRYAPSCWIFWGSGVAPEIGVEYPTSVGNVSPNNDKVPIVDFHVPMLDLGRRQREEADKGDTLFSL